MSTKFVPETCYVWMSLKGGRKGLWEATEVWWFWHQVSGSDQQSVVCGWSFRYLYPVLVLHVEVRKQLSTQPLPLCERLFWWWTPYYFFTLPQMVMGPCSPSYLHGAQYSHNIHTWARSLDNNRSKQGIPAVVVIVMPKSNHAFDDLKRLIRLDFPLT